MFFFISKFDDLKLFLEYYVLLMPLVMLVNSLIHLMFFKLIHEIVIRSFVRLDD